MFSFLFLKIYLHKGDVISVFALYPTGITSGRSIFFLNTPVPTAEHLTKNQVLANSKVSRK